MDNHQLPVSAKAAKDKNENDDYQRGDLRECGANGVATPRVLEPLHFEAVSCFPATLVEKSQNRLV